jgi:hypothetical protein
LSDYVAVFIILLRIYIALGQIYTLSFIVVYLYSDFPCRINCI